MTHGRHRNLLVSADVRPELTALTDAQKQQVLDQARRQGKACADCGAHDFVVGDALYLGFLFLSAAQDAYMVALSCLNPACTAPRTGITLHEAEFLTG